MASTLAFIFAILVAGANASWWDSISSGVSDLGNKITEGVNDISGKVTDLTNNVPGQLTDLTGKVNDLANGQLADLTNQVNDFAGNIPGLSELSNLPALLSEFELKSLTPKCEFKNNIASCCTGLSDLIPTQLCANFLVSYNELSVIASLSYNNKTLVQRRVEVGQICVPVPGVSLLSACLHFYWVEVGTGNGPSDFKCNFCFQGSATAYATIDFHCLRFENGQFSLNSDHSPVSKGYYNYDVKK